MCNWYGKYYPCQLFPRHHVGQSYKPDMQKNSFSREYLEKMKAWLEANKDLMSDYRVRYEEENQ